MPSVLTPNVAAWTLAARGGPVDGETLVFKPRPGDPTGTPTRCHPAHAILQFQRAVRDQADQSDPVRRHHVARRRSDVFHRVRRSRVRAVRDRRASRSTRVGEYTARLTVVDRFGRVDSETADFEVRSLVTTLRRLYWQGSRVSETYSPDMMNLFIQSQNGTAVTGDIQRTRPRGGRRTFSGTVDADGSVRLVLSDSAGTLVGTLTLGAE